MIYSIGKFILDPEKEHLLLGSSREIISNHSRTIQLLSILVKAYPKIVSKNELTQALWPDDDVTEWALSRQISQVRQLLATHDPETHYIKTVHTKGFKLEMEPRVIEKIGSEKNNPENSPLEPTKSSDGIGQEEPQSAAITQKNNRRWGRWLLTGILGCLLLVAFFGYKRFKNDEVIYGEIIPKKNIPLPVNANWSSTQPDTIRYTPDGIHIEPIGPDSLFVLTSLTRAAFYQGAIFSINMQVNQEFVDNKGWLRLYYQSTLAGWPGEWDCGVDDSIIQTLNFEYQCRIDENGNYTKIFADETVNFGIKIHQLKAVGHAVIKSAEINLPASISTDKGWRTSNGVPLDYNRGVAYEPKTVADELLTRIKGPVNIPGSKIAFTIHVDNSYQKPDSVLQFFIINKNGKWQDCFVDWTKITSNVSTHICDFQNIKDPFILNENEKVEIGMRPSGKNIKGKLQIIGITVNE